MITLRLGNRHHKDITLLHELIEELRKASKRHVMKCGLRVNTDLRRLMYI